MLRLPLFVFLICLLGQTLSGQITYGFKAGLNFSKLVGPLEQDIDGKDVEKYEIGSGFHVGAAFNYKIYDRFGVRAELIYSQKGGNYKFDGPTYRVFEDQDGDLLVTMGTGTTSLKTANSYLDFPIMFYARMVPWLEVSLGVNAGILIGSTAQGELNYNGLTPGGSEIDPVRFLLDYRYFKDDAGEIVKEGDNFIMIGGNVYDIPNTVGAYYDFETKNGSFYNVFDLGLNAGVHFFINKGLFLGVRLNYGLLDVTNKNYEFSQTSLLGGAKIQRDDADKNLSIQTSIGFSF